MTKALFLSLLGLLTLNGCSNDAICTTIPFKSEVSPDGNLVAKVDFKSCAALKSATHLYVVPNDEKNSKTKKRMELLVGDGHLDIDFHWISNDELKATFPKTGGYYRLNSVGFFKYRKEWYRVYVDFSIDE